MRNTYKEVIKLRKKNGFLFIGDIINSDFKESFIAKNYKIKRANASQVKDINDFIVSNFNSKYLIWYENDKVMMNKNHYSSIALTENDYKYWIIEYSENQASQEIYNALKLFGPELTIISEHLPKHDFAKSIIFISNRVNNFYNPRFHMTTKKLEKKDIIHLREIIDLQSNLMSNEKEYSNIIKSINDFQSIDQIPTNSAFKVVALLSIFENLLTTDPFKSNSNSITMQLQSKIHLLSRRFDSKIDLHEYFQCPDTTTIKTVVEKIYKYRSKIAHGDEISFDNELQILTNKDSVIIFLNALLKKILIQALIEPELVKDLKSC